MIWQTPFTNRGSVTYLNPLEGLKIDFSIHWLELTVWADLDAVLAALESAVFDVEPVPGWPGCWTRHDVSGRILSRSEAFRGFDVLDYLDDGYCGVRIKGVGCEVLGDDLLARVLGAFGGVRWRVSRVDVAWDGGDLGPKQIRRLLNNGHFNSRAKLQAWYQDSDSATCYSHKSPEKRGIERWFRVYDSRGFNRFEWVLKGDHAAAFGVKLAESLVCDWARISTEALRGFVDFLQPGHGFSGTNKYKAPLHPAWEALVGAVDKWRPDLGTSHKRLSAASEVLDRAEAKIIRQAAELQEYIQAFGESALLDLIASNAADSVNLSRVDVLKLGLNERIHPWEREYHDIPF